MKRGTKLIALLGVLILLSGAVLLVRKLNPETGSADESASDIVFQMEKDDVTAITWQYLSQTCSFTREGDSWVYDKDARFPLNHDYIDTMLKTVASIESSKVITEPEDLSVYGLTDPHCSVILTAGGKEYTLLFGDDTEVDDLQYFTCGDGHVCLVDPDLEEAFNYGLYDVVQKEAIPNMAKFVSLQAQTVNGDYEVDYLENSGLAYSDEYKWFLKDGDAYTVIDNDLADTFTDTVRYLVWGSCADYYADAEELSAYGFDDPTAVITVTYLEGESVDTGLTDSDGLAITQTEYRENTFTLEIGSAYGSGEAYYSRLAGSSMVYYVNSAMVDTMLNTGYADLAPDEILVMDWEEVTSVDLSLNGGNAVTLLPKQVSVPVETETDSGTADNAEADTEPEEELALRWFRGEEETNFHEVTAAIDKLYFSGYALDLTPEGEELLRLVIHRNNENFPTVELVFYPYSEDDCLVTLDGSPTVLVPKINIDALCQLAAETAE